LCHAPEKKAGKPQNTGKKGELRKMGVPAVTEKGPSVSERKRRKASWKGELPKEGRCWERSGKVVKKMPSEILGKEKNGGASSVALNPAVEKSTGEGEEREEGDRKDWARKRRNRIGQNVRKKQLSRGRDLK